MQHCPLCGADLRFRWAKDGESLTLERTCRCALTQEEIQGLVNEWIHGDEDYDPEWEN